MIRQRVAPSDARPGDVFVTMRTDIHGHVGLIVHVKDGRAFTIEGNSGNAVRGGCRRLDSFTAVVRPVGDETAPADRPKGVDTL